MSRTRKKWLVWCTAIAVVVPLAAYVPCITLRNVRDYSMKGQHLSNLRQVGLSLLEYERAHGHFPPSVVKDEQGLPLYSWRAQLLPYLEETRASEAYHLDEPWDSPRNLPLSKERVRVFDCMRNDANTAGLTRFQVLVGPDTAFERDGLSLADIPDPANTILIVESGTLVPWSKPEDIAYDPAKPLPPLGAGWKRPVKFMCYNLAYKSGFYAFFADGSVRFIDHATDEQQVRRLMTRNPMRSRPAPVAMNCACGYSQ